MSNLSKAIGVLRRDGLLALFKKGIPFVYDHHIAPRLPRTDAQYNGVNVNAARYFDSVLPWRAKNKPNYESGIVSGLKKHVKKGDRITIVGGGWGVTAVKAAQKTGPSGKVVVYEGSSQEIEHVTETAKKNNVQDRIEVIHSIVGPNISLRGESGESTHTTPEELPNCDILELDCEGSEIKILKNLTIQPRVILVESHGMNDSPSSKVEELLEEMSYSVISKEVADKGGEEFCRENDIYVLTALRQ